MKTAKPIEVIVPTPFDAAVWHALSSCAIEGNGFAIDAIETIRRVKAGEPVGVGYVERLNGFMRQQVGA